MNKVKILITGKNPNLYIKRYIFNKIEYYNYKVKDRHNIVLIITYNDFLKLSKKNTVYKLSIIKYYGPIKYIRYLNNNVSFFICFILSVCVVLYLSNICFDIDIVHNNKNIRSIVRKELHKHNIRRFYVIPGFNKREIIINDIVNNNKDYIEWLEIEKVGNKLIIKVTERKINKNKHEQNIRNIVASKEGIIKKIVASKGQILKKENDYVAKDEIIISGNIIKDDSIKMQVPATGKVYAETWYNVQVIQPLYRNKTLYRNIYKKNVEIVFLKKIILGRKSYKGYSVVDQNVLLKNKVFPFNIIIKKYQKTYVVKNRISSEFAKRRAIEEATIKLCKLLDSDEYIMSKKILSFNTNNSKIIIDVFVSVYENITKYKNIEY